MIDIFDLNYDISCRKAKQIDKIEKFHGKGILYGMARYFGGMMLSLVLLRINILCFNKKYILTTTSSNQSKAIEPLRSKGIDSSVVSLTVAYKSVEIDRRYPDFIAYFISLFFIPCYFFELFKCDCLYRKRAMLVCFDRFVLSYGLYILNLIMMKFSKAKYVVFSNDHCVWHRALLKACEKNKVKTVYLQHAVVANNFPKLRFDYSFLDGEQAFKCYGNKSLGKVYLVGALRYQKFACDIKKENMIALCFNTLDSIDFISNMIRKVTQHFNMSIVVRPHPRDTRKEQIQMIATKYNASYSDPCEDSLSLLCRCKMMLAGVSGIHLDAIMVGCFPFTLRGWGTDFYGFISDGIVTECEDISHIDIDDTTVEKFSLINYFNARYGNEVHPEIDEIIHMVLEGQDYKAVFSRVENNVFRY
ncbi:membrane hypothetical protein [Vibrio chagasii]|nr:membrane hypothetical protein [Vibrio chagasii]